MCLSIPYKIKYIEGDNAFVSTVKKKDKKIGINLLKNLKIGDWILVLNNFAIQKITNNEARQIINLYKYDKNK